MGNKPIGTETNPLILVPFKILTSHKDFLVKQGNASAFIRKLIDAQMSSPEVRTSELEEIYKQKEAEFNIAKAQLSESKATAQQKQAASQGREEIIVKIARRLKSNLNRNHYRGGWDVTKDFPKLLKTNVSDENRMPAISNGGVEPIQEDEVLAMIYKILEAEAEAETKAKVKKVRL